MTDSTVAQIERVLDQIRPAIQMDGGNLVFVDFDEPSGLVTVELQGACVGCPMSQITLKMGVEAALRDAIPQVQQVVAVNA